MSSEVQTELANIVIAQPNIANQVRQIGRMTEQQQSELFEDYFRRVVAFFPLASALRINVILTVLGMWAQQTDRPEVLKAIDNYNYDAI